MQAAGDLGGPLRMHVTCEGWSARWVIADQPHHVMPGQRAARTETRVGRAAQQRLAEC